MVRTVQQWREFVGEWEDLILPNLDFVLRPAVARSIKRLFRPPADEEAISRLLERVGPWLPPDYLDFLRASDGFYIVPHGDQVWLAGSSELAKPDAAEIAWFERRSGGSGLPVLRISTRADADQFYLQRQLALRFSAQVPTPHGFRWPSFSDMMSHLLADARAQVIEAREQLPWTRRRLSSRVRKRPG